MALKVIKLPDIGEGVAEAEVVEWHVAVGDEVAEDQILAAVMTDKATVEIPSPFAGRVVNLGGEVGAVLPVGGPLVGIETESGSRSAADRASEKSRSKPEAQAAPSPQEGVERASPTTSVSVGESASAAKAASPARPAATAPPPATRPPAGERAIASPAVRRRALEAGVDLRQVNGTGPAGRISHDDLANFVHRDVGAPARSLARNTSVQETKIVGLRRKIAEKTAESSRRIAHFSYIEEVDVTALEELRAHLNEKFAKERTKLTILPFIVRALIVALRDFPQMNAHFEDDRETIVQYGAAHVGIATQTPAGLMVPVLRDAEMLTLWDCATQIRRVADAARNGSATRDELTGSTITITSLGALGGLATTPVINRPEVAIIGVNRMAIRPVWLNDQFVPRQMMNLSSSFDHRVIDGDGAARFIQSIKKLLELPATLFIET